MHRAANRPLNFALALISFGGQTGNVAMADKLYEHLQDKRLNIVSALTRFYADQDESEKACIVQNFLAALSGCASIPSWRLVMKQRVPHFIVPRHCTSSPCTHQSFSVPCMR